MKQIYFLLPDYPHWFDGAIKYQTKVFHYFNTKSKNVYVFGKTVEVKHSKYRALNLLYKVTYVIGMLIGMVHISKIPKRSIIILNNSFFLNYLLPLAINKYWKRHIYFLIVHDLVQRERPTFLRKQFESFFIRNSDKVIAVSSTTRADLLENDLTDTKNVPVVCPGLDIDFSKLPKKKTFPRNKELLFVGTVEKRKGLIYLIESLARIPFNDFQLKLIGGVKYPDYESSLRKKVRELGLTSKVSFCGRVNGNVLENYYLNSTVFVFPTLWEGYGMAVAEAMAYGLPVVASKIPAIQEFLDDGKEGFLVEPGDSVELSEKLTKLLNDSELLQLFSQNGSLKARSFPTWSKTSESIWNIVNEI